MNPFASIEEDRPTPPSAPKTTVKLKLVVKKDHTEARRIYAAYLVKVEELKRHLYYAECVAKATDGGGMTPVKPLATMGTNGGALLCDHCRKPIILEGGHYHKVYADEAWKRNPNRENKWMSYISGGLVVRIVENGTLRIYHGYDGSPGHCCTIAKSKMDAEITSHKIDHTKTKLLASFLADEFPDRVNELLSAVVSVMLSYDPGIGVNQPY